MFDKRASQRVAATLPIKTSDVKPQDGSCPRQSSQLFKSASDVTRCDGLENVVCINLNFESKTSIQGSDSRLWSETVSEFRHALFQLRFETTINGLIVLVVDTEVVQVRDTVVFVVGRAVAVSVA